MSIFDRLRGRKTYTDDQLRGIMHSMNDKQKTALYATSIGATTSGNAQRPVRDFSQYAHEGYKLNSVAFSCVQRIAKTFGMIDWQIMTDTDEPVPVPNHPLAKVLRRPNSQMQGVSFFEAYAVNYQLFGNSYIDATTMLSNITELWLPKPARIEAVPGKFGTPERYKHEASAQIKSWWFDPATGLPDLGRSDGHMLMHSRTANPTSDQGADWYGMSPLEAAAYAVDQHNQASVHNKALLDNGMAPSGAYKYAPPEASGLESTMSDASYDRLKAMIRETKQGAANAGNAMILEGYLDYVEMGMTPKDGDFAEIKAGVAREICNVFGVPFVLVVSGQSTYNNVKEARLELAKETVLPFAERFASDFTAFIQHIYPDIRVVPDVLSIPSIRENAIEQAVKVDAITAWTINEKRLAGGIFVTPVDGGDEVLVGTGLLPLSFDVDDGSESLDDDANTGHLDEDNEG